MGRIDVRTTDDLDRKMGEIMDGINIQRSFSDLWKAMISVGVIFSFQTILNDLITREKIKTNLINGTYYYMAM